MTPKLRQVIRLDSLPLDQTYYTPEGYLVDRPILTSTGIFEYLNPDGSVRRELRLPEDVFDAESLKSYKGRPIIITHDAGLVTKDNVQGNQIGTILTEGYRSGDDVRAEIIIHDTDGMKKAGLKEISLGYNLDLDETPGEWNGQHYDAIQRNIRINHLALVRKARAGEQARLNIDSRDSQNSLIGGKVMKGNKTAAHSDGVLTPEELTKAIEEYMEKRNMAAASEQVAENPPAEENEVEDASESSAGDAAPTGVETAESANTPSEQTTAEKMQMVKDRRDARINAGAPADLEAAQGVITQQDEDMGILFDIIDSLIAEKDFDNADGKKCFASEADAAEVNSDAGCKKKDAALDSEKDISCNSDSCKKNNDSSDYIDGIVRERIQLGMIGKKLNMDGLESMRIPDAKKAIINAVRPGMNLDGKSDAYIDAAYDMAVSDIEAKSVKDTNYQKHQMFNADGTPAEVAEDSSAAARNRMIARQTKNQ